MKEDQTFLNTPRVRECIINSISRLQDIYGVGINIPHRAKDPESFDRGQGTKILHWAKNLRSPNSLIQLGCVCVGGGTHVIPTINAPPVHDPQFTTSDPLTHQGLGANPKFPLSPHMRWQWQCEERNLGFGDREKVRVWKGEKNECVHGKEEEKRL